MEAARHWPRIRRIVVEANKVDARALLRDKVVLAGTALVLSALVVAAWFLFAGSGLFEKNKDGPRYTHMHCPECWDESTLTPALVGKVCPSCNKGKYTPTVGSVLEGGGSLTPAAKVVIFLLLTALLLQGLAFLVVQRLRALRRAAAEVVNRKLVCRCPYCKRKLAYPVARVGSGAVCSQCKTGFTLPGADQAEPLETV
jgi:Zn finger protein HypA/HybF involved in hydrogenase expression